MLSRKNIIALLPCLMCGLAMITAAQTRGTIKGTVTLEDQRVHNVFIIITQLKLSTQTDEQGNYELRDVPVGTYSLVARLDRVPDAVRPVTVTANQTTTADIQLQLIGIRDQVTVSATGNEQTAFEAFQGVTALDSTTLLEQQPTSLGEALERQPGIAKRSSGPGSSRPVIRGFDGDRVLIAQDGIRTGSISYSSGDHGEPVNLLSVERVEVVRGPATLIYGSSAIGGLVNIVSGHEQAHEGVHGFFSGVGGTNNSLGGASGGIEMGGNRWGVWGSGGGQRTGDYHTPLGRIFNSESKSYDVTGGAGYFGKRSFFSGSYNFNRNEYGVPYDPNEEDAELAALNPRRHNLRLNGGINNLTGLFDHAHFTFDYTDYKHEELIDGEPETRFFNKTYSYRAIVEQQRRGRYSGTLGVSGFRRDYEVIGDEALVPPVKQDSFAAFALQGIDLGRVAFQLGARIEHNDYDVEESDARRNRSFTGFSGSLGVRVPLWQGGALAANYTHAYRAPSLDELYNFGPHPGNLTFEIGNTNLVRESSDGLDVSLRHVAQRLRAEFHYFYYRLHDFVFLAPTGDEDDNLPVAEYLQGNSRYQGTEFDLGINLHRTLWLNAGLDYVNAKLIATDTPLPRIPPLRARVGFDFQAGGFRLFPELVMARDQDRLFPTETRTAGYGVLNLLGSYTLTQEHAAHVFAVQAFNLNDKLYRNHLSFIKEFAPEIGRGVRFTYTVRFF
jgi:iron complex outermembrane recepter protein